MKDATPAPEDYQEEDNDLIDPKLIDALKEKFRIYDESAVDWKNLIRRITMRKVQAPQNLNWTVDWNEDETELGSRTTLINKHEKKKKRIQAESSLQSLKASKRNINDSKSAEFPDESVRSYDSDLQVEPERLPKLFDKKKSKKLADIRSKNFEESIESPASKGIDVIVDVHREYKDEKSRYKNGEQMEPSDKTGHKFSKRSKDAKVFSKGNTFHRINEKLDVSRVKNQQSRDQENVKAADSVDLIEEYQESTANDKRIDRTPEVTLQRRSTEENLFQASVKENLRSRRQWDVPEIVDHIEDTKKPRKRWSKDTTVIRLPDAKSISSATSSSVENVSPLIQNIERPIPATRASLQQESLYSFDNPTFVSENEEILRVETNPNRETKIEMRKITESLENIVTSPPSNQSSNDSLSEINATDNTVVPLKRLHEFRRNPDARSLRKQGRSTAIDVENSEDSDISKLSSKRRTSDRRSIGKENSIEEFRNQRYDLSDEELITNDQTWTNDGTNLVDKGDDSRSHAMQDELSINEDDATEDNSQDIRIKRAKQKAKRRNTLSESSDRQKERQRVKTEVRKDETSSSAHAQRSNVEEETKKKKKKRKKKITKKDDVKYISVTIHRADMLEIDYVTKHPMVKVHILYAETGKYLRNPEMHEGQTRSTYLQPVITGKFDFKENKSIVPIWEEELIFEHDFDALLKTEKEQLIILFEIVDLLSFAEASFNYDKFGNEGCWYKIAWAFLKPVGRNNTLHIDKKVRLQLYRPQRNFRNFERHRCEVYEWWKSNSREKYPSSLFVSLASIDPPKLEPVFYQQLSLQDLSDGRSESRKDSVKTSDSINLPKWTRLAAQTCKIPNEKSFETEISENGCFFVTFSNDGKYLACVLSEEYDYPIVVYEIESKKIHVRFTGHKTFVYSLNWSGDNNYLLSVSSDQTARVWDVRNQIVQHIEMMPHPSYVYCGKFHCVNSSIISTGCYDRTARIWVKDKKSKNLDLSQELEGHEGFVNSMCFQKDDTLLTADNVGVIIVWSVKRNRKMPLKKEWHISRKVKLKEIDGVTINTIVLHPLESRLLVHSRDNGLRMLDLATGVVLQKYDGLNNQRIQSTACISPCGGLILCGGEDSSLNVWNLETGKYIAKYIIDRNFRAVTCVDYHPYDHVLAYSTFGSPSSVKVLTYSKTGTGEDVGLNIFGETEGRMRNIDQTTGSRPSVFPTYRGRSLSNVKTDVQQKSNQSGRSLCRNESVEIGVHPDNERRYANARLKLQRLNETEQTLKSRSASRLYNIIEKIDRILSNTSKSSDDLESGRSQTFAQESGKSRMAIVNEQVHEIKGRRNPRKSPVYSSIEDHSNSYFESSTSSSVKNEALELKVVQSTRTDDQNVEKKRSRSAKELRSKKTFEDELSKTFSDSAANTRKLKVYDEIIETMEHENYENSFAMKSVEGRNLNSMDFCKSNCSVTDQSDSPGSTGTYVVGKSDLEKSTDGRSTKNIENITPIRSQNGFNDTKASESESSLLSNATFTIENEFPVPKPRKKKNVI